MATETEAQNYMDATYNTTLCVSNITLTENTTGYDLNTAAGAAGTWVIVNIIMENSTGTVYPLTYTFGGVSLAGNV